MYFAFFRYSVSILANFYENLKNEAYNNKCTWTWNLWKFTSVLNFKPFNTIFELQTLFLQITYVSRKIYIQFIKLLE